VSARRMARAARAAAAAMTWPNVADRTAQVYAGAAREERSLRSARSGAAPLRMLVRDGNLLADEG